MRLLLLLLLLSPTRRHRNSSSHPTDFINFHPHFRPLFCCPFDIFHILISERKIKDNRGKLQRRIPWVRCFLLFFFSAFDSMCVMRPQIDPLGCRESGGKIFILISSHATVPQRFVFVRARSADAQHYCFEPDVRRELSTRSEMRSRDTQHIKLNELINFTALEMWKSFGGHRRRRRIKVQRSSAANSLFMTANYHISRIFCSNFMPCVCLLVIWAS